MLWFTVWTVLVLGAGTGAFLLGRSLWRKVQDLGAAAAEASDAFARLADQVDALAEAAGRAEPVRADLFDDTQALRERVAGLRREAAGRRVVRQLRHQETYARWRAYSR
ncbi:hypothetical protein [Cellulomonas cellasea]|uniref:Uncharacterized protein n=2 Tax=Cellulomonas cellasea TaxID=43670 RepID=A0A0A0BA66_9CELL|nr:hypothetical protein [Cellulomonas cellasea]KGM02982.1 hypothetical protein Q760_09990 [Cellulomonas cellasea DSM 20118]GEA88762.1 hypothetical protein CCE01nite_27110 [Cellulomonas cellasea]